MSGRSEPGARQTEADWGVSELKERKRKRGRKKATPPFRPKGKIGGRKKKKTKRKRRPPQPLLPPSNLSKFFFTGPRRRCHPAADLAEPRLAATARARRRTTTGRGPRRESGTRGPGQRRGHAERGRGRRTSDEDRQPTRDLRGSGITSRATAVTPDAG